MASNTVSVTVPFEVKIKRLGDLLCCALEGGSNYWYRIEKFVIPDKFENYCFEEDDKSKQPEIFRHIDYPTNPGGAIIVSDFHGNDDDEEGMTETKVDLEQLQKGLMIMAQKYPKHFSDFMNENEDADTGDVFLQCCVLGELVYG